MADIRKAKTSDVPHVQKLINYYADQKVMLHRSLGELYERVRDLFVCVDDGRVVGCVALCTLWEDLAEVRSLCVTESHKLQGIGAELVKNCIAEATALGCKRVMTLTYEPEFFERFGFRRIDKETLPHKIWADCVKCPHFPDCDEVALILELPA